MTSVFVVLLFLSLKNKQTKKPLHLRSYEHKGQLFNQGWNANIILQRLVTNAHVMIKFGKYRGKLIITSFLFKKKKEEEKKKERKGLFLSSLFKSGRKNQYVVIPILLLLEQNGQTYTGHMMQVTKSTKSYSDKSFCSKGNNYTV